MIPLLLLFFAGDWPQFRGPNAAGVSDEQNLPLEFGPNQGVVWKTPLSRGNSSPVIAGNRIFLTGAEGERRLTFALDRNSGKILWRREITVNRHEVLHKLNDPASPTPVTDGVNVYVFFGDFGLASYGPDGEERWRLPLGPFTNLHGMAASPVLAGSTLLMNCDQDYHAFALGIDKDTGKVRWKAERSDITHGFSTPVVYRGEMIVPGAYQMVAYSIATGEKVWWVRGLTWQPKSPPVISGDVLYFNGWAPGGDPGEQKELPPWSQVLAECDANRDGKLSREEVCPPYRHSGSWEAIDLDKDGFLNERDWNFYRARRSSRNGLLAVRLGGKGDVTDTHVLWRYGKSLPDVPAPLLYRGVLFLVKSGGIATSLDPATGQVLELARLTGALEDYYASPVGADGKVYMLSQGGKVVVLKAAAEWEILKINDMEEELYATPAIVDGAIYLRTVSTLYCLKKTLHN